MKKIIFITTAEMVEVLGILKPYTYKIIKQLNEELERFFMRGWRNM